MIPKPTDLPNGRRRTILVAGVTIPQRPATLRTTFRAAARIIAANGLHQGDFVADAFDRRLTTPHAERPMSIVAAIQCAVSGSPHQSTDLAACAIAFLAGRLFIDECGPYGNNEAALAFHVDAWGDIERRTTASACAVLEAAADACEVTA